MINRYLYGDISNQVEDKCFKLHGGTKFLFFRFLSAKAKDECKRIMSLKLNEIYKFLKEE